MGHAAQLTVSSQSRAAQAQYFFRKEERSRRGFLGRKVLREVLILCKVEAGKVRVVDDVGVRIIRGHKGFQFFEKFFGKKEATAQLDSFQHCEKQQSQQHFKVSKRSVKLFCKRMKQKTIQTLKEARANLTSPRYVGRHNEIKSQVEARFGLSYNSAIVKDYVLHHHQAEVLGQELQREAEASKAQSRLQQLRGGLHPSGYVSFEKLDQIAQAKLKIQSTFNPHTPHQAAGSARIRWRAPLHA